MKNQNLKVGDVLMVSSDGFISRLIRLFTLGKYSHCCMYIGDGQMIESTTGGVQVNPIDRYEFSIYRHKTATKQQLFYATEWAKSQIGSGYDYWGVFGILASRILRKEYNWFDDKNRYWCSELVADAYIKSGIDIDVCPETYFVSPNDLARELEKVCDK